MLLNFGRWQIEIDPEATRAASVRAPPSGPQECGCRECRNFLAARAQAYPPLARELFELLGLEPPREAEVCHTALLPSGLHLYGGWLHAVGEILAGLDAKQPAAAAVRTFHLEPLTERFSLGFTSDAQLVPAPFAGRSVVQVEFLAEVPWVLAEPFAG